MAGKCYNKLGDTQARSQGGGGGGGVQTSLGSPLFVKKV